MSANDSTQLLRCGHCSGTGSDYSYRGQPCRSCGGLGMTEEPRNGFGQPSAYPRLNEQGETVWACCESAIGPVCRHRASKET